MKKIVASIVGLSLLSALALDLPASAASKKTQVNSASTNSSVTTDRLAAKKVKSKSPKRKKKK